MWSAESFEKLASSVADLDRSQVKNGILNFKGGLKLDFTESYLDSLSIDKLRHILLAAMSTLEKTGK